MTSRTHTELEAMPVRIRTTLRRAILLPIALFVILTGLLLYLVVELESHGRRVTQAEDIIGHAHRLQRLMVDAETGIRGYYLTGAEIFLEPYKRAQAEVTRESAALRAQVSDNAPQARRLEQIDLEWQAWQDFWQGVEEAEKTGRDPKIRIRSLQGKIRMDSIRALMNAFVAVEETLRIERSAVAEASYRKTLALVVFVGVLIVGFLSVLTRRAVRMAHEGYSSLLGQLQVALETRDEFLSIASHELKTPLTAIKLQLHLVRKLLGAEAGQGAGSEKVTRAVRFSEGQVDRLGDLIEDLLDVTRIRAGKLALRHEEFDFAQLVTTLIEQYETQFKLAGCTLEFKADGPCVVNGDPMRLEQVVVNLFTNATKYAAGSEVSVEVSCLDGDRARFEIRDTGAGIAQERIERIFDRFERATSSRDISGLGLGLFIARSIVEAHHGSIQVTSTLGKGSSFVIELPLAGARAVPASQLSART